MVKLKHFTARETTSRSLTRLGLKELVCPVHGFFVRVNTRGVERIENITNKSAIDDPYYRDCYSTRLFWLIDGEHVVEVSYTVGNVCSSNRVTAIRFRTNLRDSRWFGEPTAREFVCVAEEGMRVHAISSQIVDGFTTKLDAVLLPLASAQEVLPKVRLQQVLASHKTGKAFISCSSNVRAVFVDLMDLSIMVLSTEDYDRYLSMQGSVHVATTQHLEELIPGEKLVGLDYTTKVTTLSAFRLVTTHRTTPWFGYTNDCERLSVTCGDTEGAYICGFAGIVGPGDNVVALSVMVTTPESS